MKKIVLLSVAFIAAMVMGTANVSAQTAKKAAKKSEANKQAMIASSLALNTSIVLMDEPSNGLDIPSKSLLRKVVAQNAAEDKLFIISTHQVRDLENIIDPIIIMDNKQVLLNASIEQITDKLYFTTRETKIENTLYSEFTPNGYTSVELNKDGLQSKVNLESLFNATMAYRDIFKTMFNN